ncbi:MAG: hypothetical protein ACD_75C01698G0001, partial [uncultured bacterium]
MAGGEYTIDYDKYSLVEGVGSGAGTGVCLVTLPNTPVKPGSVALNVLVAFSGYQHVYPMRDDGAGNLSAPGWELALPVNHPTWPGLTQAGGITGTIDYTTGICTIDLVNVAGTESWKEPYVFRVCAGSSGAGTPAVNLPAFPA